MSSESNVLIVGAGALGVTTGYHLGLAGAGISFLVRPARVSELQGPLALYCFDDGELKQFSDYRVAGSVAEAAQQVYDFVLITLDGAACKSQEGVALLKELGDAIRASSAVAMANGVGVREHCRDTMQLPDDRVLEGTMGIFSYQTDRVSMPLHEPTDPAKLARSAFAYRHASGKTGFMVAGHPKAPAKAFAALYNRCGVSRCNVLPRKLYSAFTASFFPIVASLDMAGWPDAETMAKDAEALSLSSRATKEIMSLPQFGLPGRLASLMMGPKAVAKNLLKSEKSCLPMDYIGFTRFHHGGKVREQNVMNLQAAAESGRSQGRAMPALDEIIRRYEAHLAGREAV